MKEARKEIRDGKEVYVDIWGDIIEDYSPENYRLLGEDEDFDAAVYNEEVDRAKGATTGYDLNHPSLEVDDNGQYVDENAAWNYGVENNQKPDAKGFSDNWLADNLETTRQQYANAETTESTLQDWNTKYTQSQKLSDQERTAKGKAFRELEYKKEDVSNVATAALTAGKLAQATGDIAKGKQRLQELEKPKAPGLEQPTQLNEMARQAMAEAGKGFSDRTRGALAAQNIASQALAAKSARQAAGGQASVAGALGQQQHVTNLRQNLQQAMAEEQAGAGKRGIALDAAGRLAQEGARRNQIRESRYMTSQQDFQREQDYGRRQRATGGYNLARALETMPEQVTKYAGDYYKMQQQRGIVPTEGMPGQPGITTRRDRINSLQQKANFQRNQGTQPVPAGVSGVNPNYGQQQQMPQPYGTNLGAWTMPPQQQQPQGNFPLFQGQLPGPRATNNTDYFWK